MSKGQGHRKLPLIAITCDYDPSATRYQLRCDYATAVEKAGGIPVLLPFRTDLSLIPSLLDHLDGVVLAGGDDLDPALYGELRHPRAQPLDIARQRFELALLAEIERRAMPAIGICLGAQMINVHRGGSLHQFLPDLPRGDGVSPIEHRKLSDGEVRHAVNVALDSAVGRARGKSDLLVNSSHKQSIHRLGRGLRVIATSSDGIIEGVEDPTLPLFVGVQWHPERLHDEPDHLAIFRMLVEKSQNQGAEKARAGRCKSNDH